MNKEKIIEYLKNEIEGSERLEEPSNEKSWVYEIGVLLSADEAKFIVELLNERHKNNLKKEGRKL